MKTKVQQVEEVIKTGTTKEELAEINAIFPKDAARGLRYPEQMMGSLNK